MRSWADDFNTFEEACHYYGADTPAQLAEEGDWRDAECLCEEAFGPYVYGPRQDMDALCPLGAEYEAVRAARLAPRLERATMAAAYHRYDDGDDMPF